MNNRKKIYTKLEQWESFPLCKKIDKNMGKEGCNFTSGLVELIMSNIGWPTGMISGKNIQGSFWLIVNMSSKGISMITCTDIKNGITGFSISHLKILLNEKLLKITERHSLKTTELSCITRITYPGSTKRFHIFGSKYSKSIRPLPKFNSICSNSSNVSNLIKVRVCWL